MSLTLTLRNAEAAPEGIRSEFTLEGDGAVIGRSKNCDWNLPDPKNIVSSRHAEIRKQDGNFVLKDISTNGTFLNGAGERMSADHVVANGDVIRIGDYELVATVKADAPPPPPPPSPPPPPPPDPQRTIVQPAGPAEAAIAPSPEPVMAAPAAAEPAAVEPAAAGQDRVPENVTVMWDSLADINKVDWARGGLGVSAEAAAASAGAAGTTGELVDAFVESLSLGDNEVARSPELVAKAGSLLRRLVAGMFVMIEARARAKAQMGAEATGLQLEGNNPIKFARTPEQALARLLSPAEPGFMNAEKAIEDGFLDLQSHQVATLRAIPGALRATLDRFSPGSVRRRAEKAGVLARILPALQDAALWRNYEREYVKVKNESDEAFMEVFAKEFRKAYERQLREGFKEEPKRGVL